MSHVFQCNVFQHNVFQGTCGGSGQGAGGSAVPMRGTWNDWWKIATSFNEFLVDPNALSAEDEKLSPEQKRLFRKLRMLEEQLFDATGREARAIEIRIKQIKDKLAAEFFN